MGSGPAEHDELAGTTIEQFRLISRIGGGGMGVVWLAEDTELRRQVALKVMRSEFVHNPTLRRRFLREGRNAARLQHPSIATVHAIGETEDRLYLVMEYIRGRTLREALRVQRFTVAEALAIAIPLAEALAHAHAEDLVHRDLKPENVILAEDGRPRLLDFGIAKLLEREQPVAGVTDLRTAEGVVLGTPEYMSPEQACGGVVDKRSDVFSFGVMLYELLAHERPFTGATSADVIQAVIRDDPKPLADVSPGLQQLVARCLAKRPAQRFETAQLVLEQLQRVANASASEPLTTSSTETRVDLPPARRRRIVPLLVAGAGLVAIAGVVAWRLLGTSRGPQAVTETRITELPANVSLRVMDLAADGRTVVYGTHDTIWSQPVAGGARRELRLPPDQRLTSVGLLPGGRLVTAEKAPSGGSAIWMMAADGSDRERIVDGPEAVYPSPDGARIAYQAKRGIEILVLATGARSLVTPIAEVESIVAIAWSPRGDRLAWVRSGASVAGGATLELAAIGGGLTHVAARGGDLEGPGEAGVTFAGPDRVRYTRITGDDTELWEYTLVDGRPVGEARRLYRWAGTWVVGMRSNATGDRLVALNVTSSRDVGVLALAGRPTLRYLTNDAADDAWLEWSADSQHVMYRSARDGVPALVQQPVAGGPATVIVRGCGACMALRAPAATWLVTGDLSAPTFGLARLEPNNRLAPLGSFERAFPSQVRCSPAGCLFGEVRDGKLLLRALGPDGKLGEIAQRSALPLTYQRPAFSPSPDGRASAVVYAGDGTLRLVTSAGESRELLTLPRARLQDAAWSADGQRIYVTGMEIEDHAYAVIAVELDGRYRVLYDSEHEWMAAPRASPDGRWLGLSTLVFDSDLWRLDGL